MKYEILTYGRPELRRPAVAVSAVTREIRELARDMLTTMYARNGLGLAAQQIGRTEALCVVDIRSAVRNQPLNHPCPSMPLVMINPAITARRGSEKAQEGCLSFPEIYTVITRAREVTVTYLDLDARSQTLTAAGLLARVIQHEVDHLQGRLIADHMSVAQKAALAGRLRRLRRQSLETAGQA